MLIRSTLLMFSGRTRVYLSVIDSTNETNSNSLHYNHLFFSASQVFLAITDALWKSNTRLRKKVVVKVISRAPNRVLSSKSELISGVIATISHPVVWCYRNRMSSQLWLCLLLANHKKEVLFRFRIIKKFQFPHLSHFLGSSPNISMIGLPV